MVNISGLTPELTNELTFSEEEIKEFEIPSYQTKIYDYMFYGRSKLTNIKLHNEIKEIGKYSFQYCSSLQTISIPSSVTSIGKDCFKFAKIKIYQFTNLISLIQIYSFLH